MASLPLICPVCQQPLTDLGRVLRCPQNHSFDRAKQGYVNLLTGKKPRLPGDSRAMLDARRRFLADGHYAPLMAALRTHVQTHLNGYANDKGVVVDLGCGEGSYLEALFGTEATRPILGVDLSKEAVRLAARRLPSAKFVVADIWRLVPVATATCALLLNVFAPRNAAEFARIAAPDALLLVVIPRASHLQRLRARFGLLGIEADKREQVMAQMAPHFTLADEQALDVDSALTTSAVADLIQMTPSARHVDMDALDVDPLSAEIGESFTDQAAFQLLAFRRVA